MKGSGEYLVTQITLDSDQFLLEACWKGGWYTSYFEESVDRDMSFGTEGGLAYDQYLLGTGCGVDHCCPTISWDVQHLENNRVRLYNFFLHTRSGFYESIDPRSDTLWRYHIDITMKKEEYVQFVRDVIG